jgi:hypothetical protein
MAEMEKQPIEKLCPCRWYRKEDCYCDDRKLTFWANFFIDYEERMEVKSNEKGRK